MGALSKGVLVPSHHIHPQSRLRELRFTGTMTEAIRKFNYAIKGFFLDVSVDTSIRSILNLGSVSLDEP